MKYKVEYRNFTETIKTPVGNYVRHMDLKESNRQSHLKCEKEIEKYQKDGCTWDSANIYEIILG